MKDQSTSTGHVHDAPEIATAARPGQYTCPMHPQIVRDGPGTCPICGMALGPVLASSDMTEDPELVDMRRRFLVSAVPSLPIRAETMSGMLGATAMPWSAPSLAWAELAIATPVVLWGGWPFLVRGARSVAQRSLHMFTLIGLGDDSISRASTVSAPRARMTGRRARIVWRARRQSGLVRAESADRRAQVAFRVDQYVAVHDDRLAGRNALQYLGKAVRSHAEAYDARLERTAISVDEHKLARARIEDCRVGYREARRRGARRDLDCPVHRRLQ